MERGPCPYCAEEIHIGARRCPHCRSRLDRIAADGWHRDHPDRRLAGVAAGVAATTGLPLAVVRAGFVVLTFVHLAGPILYAALWVTMPDGPGDEPLADRAIDALRDLLRKKETVLAGHSGVGKSSLLRAVQPTLDIRVGEVSAFTQKGRHTTTSAQRHDLDVGGAVIDTPGVKLFGLWNVTRANVLEYFPDVEAGTAPEWRVASYERILESLPS